MSIVYNWTPGIHRAQLDLEQAIITKPEPWRISVDLYRPQGSWDGAKLEVYVHHESLGEHNAYQISHTHKPVGSAGECVNLIVGDIESRRLPVDACNRLAICELVNDLVWLCERYY